MATVLDRRELRRRRILENSQNRLNKILNIQSQESGSSFETPETLTEGSSSQNLKSDEELFKLDSFSPSEKIQTNKTSISDYKELTTEVYTFDGNTGDTFTDFEETLRNHNSQQQSNNTLQNKSQFIYLRYGIIVFLAFWTRYLCLVSEQYEYIIHIDTFETYLNKIFVPILIYETVTGVYFREVKTDKSFLTIVLLLGTRQNPNLQKLMTFLYHFQCIFQDIMLYFFSFVIFDLGINFLTQGGSYNVM